MTITKLKLFTSTSATQLSLDTLSDTVNKFLAGNILVVKTKEKIDQHGRPVIFIWYKDIV
jgi:hypothetical protein